MIFVIISADSSKFHWHTFDNAIDLSIKIFSWVPPFNLWSHSICGRKISGHRTFPFLVLRSWYENTIVLEFIVALEADKYPREQNHSIWHISGLDDPDCRNSVAQPKSYRFCLSVQQFQRTPWITQEAMLPSGSRRVGTARPLFHEINWITPTERAKPGERRLFFVHPSAL